MIECDWRRNERRLLSGDRGNRQHQACRAYLAGWSARRRGCIPTSFCPRLSIFIHAPEIYQGLWLSKLPGRYDAPMNQETTPCRDRLKSIARQAMLQRGLLPDFSVAAVAESNAIAGAATAAGPSFRDLRSLLWASIDNDDSRDLDQLSVAVPAEGGAVKVLVAVADVDAVVKKGSAIDGHARVRAPER